MVRRENVFHSDDLAKITADHSFDFAGRGADFKEEHAACIDNHMREKGTFLSSLSLNQFNSVSDEAIDILCGWNTLQELNLAATGLTIAQIHKLAGLSSLIDLDISNNPQLDDYCEEIIYIFSGSDLKTLVYGPEGEEQTIQYAPATEAVAAASAEAADAAEPEEQQTSLEEAVLDDADLGKRSRSPQSMPAITHSFRTPERKKSSSAPLLAEAGPSERKSKIYKRLGLFN